MAKKQTKTPNKTLIELGGYLKTCQYWTELNMMLDIAGLKVDFTMMVMLVHFAFSSIDTQLNNLRAGSGQAFNLTTYELLKSHAQNILQELVEDTDVPLSDKIIDMLVQKIVFDLSRNSISDKAVLRNIFKKIAERYPAQVKASYSRYSQFKKYNI